MRIVVTGGAGFIGSAFVRRLLREHDDVEIVNLDKLTYAGNLDNLRDVEDDPRYTFVRGDICDAGVGALRARRRRRRRQLRRRDPRRPLHQRPAGLHPHRRARHPHPARGGARAAASAASCRSRPTRSTARSTRARSPRTRPSTHRAPTRRARPGRDLLVLAAPPHLRRSRSSSPAAPTTTGPTSIPRSSSRSSSPTPSTTGRCPSTATAPTCATGCTSRTTARPSSSCCARASPGTVYNVGGGNEVANIELTRRILAELGKDEGLDHAGHRPSRSRPALLSRLRQAPCPRLAPAASPSTRASRRRSPGIATTAPGGSASSPGSGAPTTSASTRGSSRGALAGVPFATTA